MASNASSVDPHLFVEASSEPFSNSTAPSRLVTETPATPIGINAILSGNLIVSIQENRMREVGIAVLQRDGTSAAIAQFCDSHNYAQTMIFLEIYSPTEILLSDTATNTDLTKLLTLRFGSEASIVSVQRKLFSETQGLYFLENLAVEQEGGLSDAISTKYLALASFAAAVAYAEHALRANFIKGSVRVRFVGADRTLLYDPQSVAALELLCDRVTGDKKKGLIQVIDRCTTAHGKALLRANVLQPSTDLATISERQRAALELSDAHVFENVKVCLKDAIDVDKMLSLMTRLPMGNADLGSKNRLSSFIMLHHLLQKLPLIAQSISQCSSIILSRARENFEAPALEELKAILSEYLNPEIFFAKGEVRLQTQRVNAIRAGLSGLVDAARTIHGENIQDIVDLYHQYVTKYPEFPNLKLRYETKRGYFLSLPSKDLQQRSLNEGRNRQSGESAPLPAEFLQVSTQGGANKTYTFTTAALASLNTKNSEIIQEILHLSDQLIDSAVAKVRQHVMALYAIADSVAYVDMLHSFAAYCKSDAAPFCMPKLFSPAAMDAVSRNLHFSIFQGRHPITTSTIPSTRGVNREFVPTNFELLEPRSKSMMTVSGPNNSGKTTYITQIALNVILAQIGCFIPAQSAIIPIFDKMFTRIGSNDSIERNASTFMMEMKDLALVLQNATSSSLVVMDELGRSTTAEEGEALFFAACESLVRNRVVCLVSTHFQHMCEQLGAMYPSGVRNCQLAVDVAEATEQDSDEVKFRNLYIVQESTETHKISALDVAQAHGLHPELATEARRIRRQLVREVEASARERNRRLNILKIKIFDEISRATALCKEGKISAAALKDIVLHHRSRLLQRMGEDHDVNS